MKLRRRSAVAVIAVIAAALLAVTGCSSSGDGHAPAADGSAALRGTVTVFAAASLTGTFGRLGDRFEAEHPGVDVRFSFGGSSALARGITEGAPADVFAPADERTMRVVADAGLTAGTPVPFARNLLTIAVAPGNPKGITSLADLNRPGLKVALCAEQVPCGSAAKTALGAAGVSVRPVTLEQDVRAALTKLTLGEVDAALVYRTDVRASGGKAQGVDFPEAARAVNTYPIVALSKAPNSAAAREFVAFVTGPDGRAELTAAGFEGP